MLLLFIRDELMNTFDTERISLLLRDPERSLAKLAVFTDWKVTMLSL